MSLRVLIVDDESRVLNGIRRGLYVQRVPWQTAFAAGGEEALALLERSPFDAIVTDMHMAPMDGAALLERVRDGWPGVLRLVLSGHVEAGIAVRSLKLAHQLLSKPCDTPRLVEAVESGIAVRSLLADATVREAVGRLKSLPAAPKVHAEITAALGDPECDARRIAEILSRDAGLAANVLHLANSSYFPASRPATDVKTAVSRVGNANVSDLVLATEVFDPGVHGVRAERLRDAGLRASRIAARLSAGQPEQGAATTAALLADIGFLVPGIDDVAAAAGFSEHAHAEIGAYLLALWGLPMPIVEAVAHHHAPARVPRRDFGVHGIVHVATALAHGAEPDHDFLAAHGLQARWPEWKALSESLGART